MVLLFWAVMFPFQYQTFKNAGHFEYVYTAMVITGILLPCVPALINLAFEYGTINFPTTQCIAASQGVAFYTQSLPEAINGALIGTLLVLVFLNLLKVLITIMQYECMLSLASFPVPRPTFCYLQYGKAGRAWYISSCNQQMAA